MTFSIETQAPRYNTSSGDSRSLDHEETILGHLLTEKQYSLKDSLYYLTTYAKQETKSWDSTEAVSSAGFWIGMVAGGAAFMAVGAGPIGMAIGGFVAAIGSGGSWFLKDTAERVGALRRTEFELHRNHPWIRDRLWQLSQGGATAAEIVAIYDRMLFHMFANGIPSDGNTIAGSMGIQSPTFKQLTATSPSETQAQSGIQNSDASSATRSESAAPAQTVLEAIASVAAVAPSMGVSRIMSPLEILIRARFSHRAFYGGQRTGKSYLTAIASQALSLTGIKVFHMNLFSHGPEDARYWTHAARSVQCDLSSLSPDEAVLFIRQAQSILSEFKLTTDALLIIDEITSMGNLRSEHLGNLQPFINGLVSYINAIRDSSKKRHKAVWTIAPGIVATGLDQGVKELIKGLAPVLVSIPKDVSIMWEDQTLTTDMNVYGQLKINYQGITEPPSMDCDRMILIDNIWMPMGTLPPLTKIAPSSLSDEVPEARSPSQPIAPRRGKITIPTRSSSSDARQMLEQAWEVAPTETTVLDAAMELINEESNTAKREALTIAYQWARARQDKGDSVDRQTFLERARKDRNSEYLRENRDEVWEELQGLLT